MTLVMAVACPAGNADERQTSSRESPRSAMYTYGREICFLLAFLLTTYAAINISQPRISKSPPAVPFFQTDSVVEDFYDGHFTPAFEKVSTSDISFVMFYAPWDAECQKVRWHFEATARYHHKEVYFAAINCWQPESECRLLFPKIRQFPVLLLYQHPQRSNPVHYQGVREASHMIHFLRTAVRPVVRLLSVAELGHHMVEHDAVVVGFFDFNGIQAAQGYRAFFDAAVTFLERDPLREILFAVVTDKKTGADFSVTNFTSIRLYLWNETVTMDPIRNLAAENITRWITSNIHQVAVWVSPPGVKSLTLAAYMQEGPVLLLFMPRNPLLGRALTYQVLREIGLEFFNCDNSEWVQRLAKRIAVDSADWRHRYKRSIQECSEWQKSREAKSKNALIGCEDEDDVECVSFTNLARWPNSSKGSGENIHSTKHKCPSKKFDSLVDDGRGEGSIGWQRYFGTAGPRESFCSAPKKKPLCKKRSTILTAENDELSPANLRNSVKDERCRELRHARLLDMPFLPSEQDSNFNGSRIRGLACKANRTLSFLALDSLQLHQFAEGLGVDVLSRKDKTAAFIVRPEQESHYLLDGEVTKDSLVDFILKYLDNKLPRWLRSSEIKFRSPGLPLGSTQTLHLSRYSERSVPECGPDTVCVKELSSATFTQEVLNNDKHVVVFYHSPYCAFCHSIAHVFLTVARTLRSVDFIEFSRIDGDNNDLPWEFTMYRYPSILFFPARRKAESRVFPSNVLLTVSSLAKFILSNLPFEERILVMLISCDEGARYHPPSFQDQRTMEKCIIQVEFETLRAAKHRLSEYRNLMVEIKISSGVNSSKDLSVYAGSLSVNLRYLRQLSSVILSLKKDAEDRISLADAVKSVREAFTQRNVKLNSLKPSQVLDTEQIGKEINETKIRVDQLDESISGAKPTLHGTDSRFVKSQRLAKDNV